MALQPPERKPANRFIQRMSHIINQRITKGTFRYQFRILDQQSPVIS
ncbi:hypothetical protein [Spirosoma foliorum]|uniref:Uncharacterized protein n=1 Tax=Spirosoma foliorum TaxID=2710596 RepID=A0A7G5H5F4_9BACT|nr:hypothetical protein [Spirosoma foliorum]QMW06346.1 hypothetical protein H3H32_16380 [Spirosoma foliorum]